MKEYPLISCLCITRQKQVELGRVIDCFRNQTYPNKEMIIVYENDDAETKKYLLNSKADNIKTIEVKKSPNIKLGYLRNISIENANGELICQWDDDDWYHICRLEYQYESFKNESMRGCVMTQWLVFDSITSKAYLSNRRLWEGSILCEKSLMQKKSYANVSKREDTKIITQLHQTGNLFLLNNVPNLYIYVYNAKNTWDYKHWSLIFKCSTELPELFSVIIGDILKGKYKNAEGSYLIDKLLNNPIFE